MKKYIICFLLLLSVLALSGCSCSSTPPSDNGQGEYNDKIIFGGDFKLVVPAELDEEYADYIFELDSILASLTGKATEITEDSSSAYKHEIIFGDTERDLSAKAYRRLDRLTEDDGDMIGYVIYSDGANIAIAFNDEEGIEAALKELESSYFSADYGKTTVASGNLKEWTYNLKTLYEERDEAIMQERWAALKAEANAQGYNGDATVSALQALYSRYTDEIYYWMADLYDPDLGGFYYSNSGRNTLGYLPDIESTMQILNFLRYSGMNNDPKSYPEELKTMIVEFVKTKQSSVDGYFYHPQWEDLVLTDERRGRDQMWALDILRMFGERPLYTTGGVAGTLGDPTGTAPVSHMTSPIGRSTVSAVSRVMLTATLPHLQSQSAFKEYLDSQNWADAYTTGNRLAAQVTSIKAAGLLPYCIEYLNGRQKENGMWDDQLGERATNGFLKIAAIYQTAGTVIPRSDKASEFLLELLLSEEPDGTVCWTYNVWYSLDIIISLLNSSATPANLSLAREIRDDLRTNAPSYILTTTQKYAPFLKDGKVFSFTPDATSSHSQGMPVAVSGAVEGDVNATYISSIGLMGYMFGALGYERVLPYTENDYKLFIDYLEELTTVIKTGTASDGSINFNDIGNLDNVFHATSNVVTDLTPDMWEDEDPRSAGAVIADENDEEEKYGQVLEYFKQNSGLETRIELANRTINRNCHVFGFDMKFMGGDVDNGSWHTRFALYGNGKRFWSILCYTLEDGSLALGDRNAPLAVISPNEWHNVRFEYYTDTPDRACKIYVDGVFVGEGGTSDPSNGDAALSRAFIEYRNEATDVLYRFDNILVKSENTPYAPPSIDVGDAAGSHYSDATVKGERYDYDKEGEYLPSLLNGLGGTLSVTDGRLHYTLKDATGADAMIFSLPISAAEARYENLCKIFELEFSYGNIAQDAPISFLLGNHEYTLVKDSESGNLNIKDKYNNGKIIETELAPDTVYVIRFECYEGAYNDLYNITKVYINEEYAGELYSSYIGGVTKLGVKLDASLVGSDAFVTVENLLAANVDREYVREAGEEAGEVGDSISPNPSEGGDFYLGTNTGNRFDCDEIVEGDSGMKTDGVTSGSDDTVTILDGALVYTRNNITGESYMRWNHLVPSGLSSPVFIFESDFRFDGFLGNSPAQKIVIQANGISHQITPEFALSDGVQTMTLGKMTLSEGNWYNIRFELDYEAGKIYYFLDGSYMGFDYLSKSTTTYTRTLWYYLAKQTGGAMRFDNTFEGLVEVGTICSSAHIDADSSGVCDNCPMPMSPDEGGEGGGNDDTDIGNVPSNPLVGGDYYNSSASGNRFDCESVENGMQIDGVTANDAAGCKDGVFVFTRNNDTGSGESYIRWNHAGLGGFNTPVFVFETDFFFNDFTADSVTVQKIVIEAGGVRHQITPSLSEDRQTFTIGKITVTAGEWCNIRFELDYTAGSVYYFLDGEYCGFDYLEKGTTSGNRVLWYYMAKQTGGNMGFDNTYYGMLEDATICETHYDSDSDGKCDSCPLDMPEPPEPEIELPDNTQNGGNYYNGSTAGNRFDCNAVVDGMKVDGVNSGDNAECKNGVLIFERINDTGVGESYIRWNHSAKPSLTTPVFVFETDFLFNDFEVGATTFQKIVIEAGGVRHQILPTLSSDGQTLTIGKISVSVNEWTNIRFELDYTAGSVYYFQNGEYKGSDYLESTTTSNTRVLWYYMVKQTGGYMAFDNTFEDMLEDGTICETHIDEGGDGKCDNCPLDMPKEPEPEVVIPENTSGGGDYYNGSASGDRFNCDSVASGMQIDGVNSGDRAECKDGLFLFERKNDTGSGESYIRWNHSSPTGLESPVFIFETDFFFTGFEATSITSQMIRIQVNGIEHKITPALSSDRKTMTIGKFELSSDTWYNIRFEMDFGAGRINYFLNGSFAGYDALATASSTSTRVLWYYIAAQTGGVMAFDNTYQGFLEEGTAVE